MLSYRLATFLVASAPSWAAIYGTVHGVVHDPSRRPVSAAELTLRARASDYSQTAATDPAGEFTFSAVPAGDYVLTVSRAGFAAAEQALAVLPGAALAAHIQLRLEQRRETVEVNEAAAAVESDSFTPATVITRQDIARTPGADRANSLAMIASFVPGAYVAHDLLHVRGGHEISWLVDGVPIPNTSISSNAGPLFDPQDIAFLEAQRGSYPAEYGDRTYGVFDIAPRTGFERNREAEIAAAFGSFHQTHDQFSAGDHTGRFAWYASASGNRTDLGLATPTASLIHDRAYGVGGFGSVIYNATPRDLLRFVGSLRRDEYQIPNSAADQAAGVRDSERERDALVTFSWTRNPHPGALLTVSPFYHYNAASYDGGPNDPVLSTRDDLASHYAGAQATASAVTRRHNARAGVYGFWQRDTRLFEIASHAAGGPAFGPGALLQTIRPSGHLESFFIEDRVKLASWLHLSGGARLTHFGGLVSEHAIDPRIGAALRIPHLNWTLRGFYGRFYQAPPLATVSGALLQFAADRGAGFLPLRGERNEENQFGLAIPLRGWTLDADRFLTRARNFFDHDALGNSNIFLPLTIAAVRVEGWEVTARSPLVAGRARLHLAWSRQRVEGWGGIAGGLTDFAPLPGHRFALDHDQRRTLSLGGNANLPRRAWAAANLYYGSGFPDNGGPARLPGHATFDLSAGKSFGERWSVSLNAVNAANRHFLLDNSRTFGGAHYFDPRQIYVQARYRFRY